MTNTLDTPPAAGEVRARRLGLVVVTILRVVGVLALVAGGYVLYTLHAEKVEARAQHQTEIRKDRAAVIARAEGHTVYAPAGWGAAAYPTARTQGGGVSSWGTYGAVHMHVWQGSDGAIAAHPRQMLSLAKAESLCEFTARDRKSNELLAEQMRTMRCLPVPGSHARIRVLPDFPQPGSADVRLAMALPEGGRYLNLWVVDETGTITKDPVAWATGFIEDLEPYDVTGYTVKDIYQARDADERDAE